MVIFSGRQSIGWLVGSTACAIAFAGGISTLVVYKPWGVADIQREEYNAILEHNRQQAEILASSRPIVSVVANSSDTELHVPGDVIQLSFKIENSGNQRLVVNAFEAGTSGLELMSELVSSIEPNDSCLLELQWTVPETEQEVLSASATIVTNDPITPKVDLKAAARVASKWKFGGQFDAGAVTPGENAVARSYLYSQRYDDFVIVESDKATKPTIDWEACNDPKVLKHFNAKSAFRIKASLAPQERVKAIEQSIRLAVATSDGPTEWIETSLIGRFLPGVSFYGPELHMKTGLELGTILIGTEPSWSFVARFRGDAIPKYAIVKDVQPSQLQADISPIQSNPGDYRITLSLKKDATPVDFQAASQGYVVVASKERPEISNWIPLQGTIVQLDDKN